MFISLPLEILLLFTWLTRWTTPHIGSCACPPGYSPQSMAGLCDWYGSLTMANRGDREPPQQRSQRIGCQTCTRINCTVERGSWCSGSHLPNHDYYLSNLDTFYLFQLWPSIYVSTCFFSVKFQTFIGTLEATSILNAVHRKSYLGEAPWFGSPSRMDQNLLHYIAWSFSFTTGARSGWGPFSRDFEESLNRV